MAGFSLAFVLSLWTVAPVSVQCREFLSTQPEEPEYLPIAEVEFLLLSERNSSNFQVFKAELEPLFATMPKNMHGRLEPSVVRYTLHRLFAQKYGWHIRGLEPGGYAWTSSSPASVVKGKVPSYIEELLEHSLNGLGLGLEDVAVFAAALSDLIDTETKADIEELFVAMNFSMRRNLDTASVRSVVKTYLMNFLHGIHKKGSTMKDFKALEKELRSECFMWEDAQMWSQDLFKANEISQAASWLNPFTSGVGISSIVSVAEDIGHSFGKFQNLECSSLKVRLLDMEDQGTGRVPLSKFYSGVSDPDWPFYESASYLRSLGALDESTPGRPSVIIPNYLGSSSLCASPSSFYKVCCMDECESLMAGVELAVAEPVALPHRLAEIVSNLQSATVEAPRSLSNLQVARLSAIAEENGGVVPLHGRLFAQWMHHAYPRECRYPHVSGTTNPMASHEFGSPEASDTEMEWHVRQANSSRPYEAETMPWNLAEEFVLPRHRSQPQASSRLRNVMLVTAFVAAIVSMMRVSSTAWKVPTFQLEGKDSKQLV